MIEILIGTIASGKSSYCNKRAEEGAIIINDYDYSISDIESAIILGKDVVIDKSFSLTSKSRKRWIRVANSFDVPVQATVFKFALPYEHARRRYNSDNRGLDFVHWWNVALQHSSIYEEPRLEEGFDLIVYNH